MPSQQTKLIAAVLAILLAGVVVVALAQHYLYLRIEDDRNTNTGDDAGVWNEGVTVIDGDTFVLENGQTVRMLSINTQETGEPFSAEAKDALRGWLRKGPILLERDSVDIDHYGRLLRYVFVTDSNGTRWHVNLEMVREGYAHAFVFDTTLLYRDAFFDAERKARENGTGMWQPSPYKVRIARINYLEGSAGANGEYVELENYGNATLNLNGWTLKDQWTQYVFKDVALEPGGCVRVHTGSGSDNATDVFWNYDTDYRYARVWDDKGDAAFLRDSQGLMVDFMEYGDRVIES